MALEGKERERERENERVREGGQKTSQEIDRTEIGALIASNNLPSFLCLTAKKQNGASASL